MNRYFYAAFSCLALLSVSGRVNANQIADDPAARTELRQERADRLSNEADRLKEEGIRLTDQSKTLQDHRMKLLSEALALDKQWARDSNANPHLIAAFPNSNRSQRLMRADAQFMETDVIRLIETSRVLDSISKGLKVLACKVAHEDDAVNIMKPRPPSCSLDKTISYNRTEVRFLERQILRMAAKIGMKLNLL